MKWTPILAILSITATVLTAILNGINGYLVSVALAAVAGLGGYSIEKRNKIPKS